MAQPSKALIQAQRQRRLVVWLALAGLWLLVAACTAGPTPPSAGPVSSAEGAGAAPVTTSASAQAPASLPTPTKEQPPEPVEVAATVAPAAEPEAEAEATPPDWVNTASVEGDYFVLGNPNAPLRLIDYSDFM